MEHKVSIHFLPYRHGSRLWRERRCGAWAWLNAFPSYRGVCFSLSLKLPGSFVVEMVVEVEVEGGERASNIACCRVPYWLLLLLC